jgi:MtN3 and saliva related transmembrane protein
MQLTTVVGFAAGTLTTFSFLPQVFKAWRTKRCDDLSFMMLLAFAAGVLLWLVYGLFLRAAPIVAANLITLALLLTLISLKVRYRSESRSTSSQH